MIKKIELQNFRNFKKIIFEFSPKITVIVGPNASGKTNVLESLYLLSTGKSFKAKVEEEMIGYDEDICRVDGEASGAESEMWKMRRSPSRRCAGRADSQQLRAVYCPERAAGCGGFLGVVVRAM